MDSAVIRAYGVTPFLHYIFTLHKNEYFEIHGNAYKQRVSVDFCIAEALILIRF